MLKSMTALGAVIAAAFVAAPAASAAEAGVKVGVLECNVAGGAGFIFGSSKDMACLYTPTKGPADTYVGEINKYGVDIGYTEESKLVWAVFAPASDIQQGALEGDYVGATAGAAIAVGLGANVLVGGMDESFALQPVSTEASEGLNLAVGVAEIRLKAAVPAPDPS